MSEYIGDMLYEFCREAFSEKEKQNIGIKLEIAYLIVISDKRFYFVTAVSVICAKTRHCSGGYKKQVDNTWKKYYTD